MSRVSELTVDSREIGEEMPSVIVMIHYTPASSLEVREGTKTLVC